MKKLYSFVFCFIIATSSICSQTTYTWRVGNGAWNVSGNWSPNGIPGDDDIVQFNNGGVKTVSGISSSYSLAKLTVTGNTSVKLEYTSSKTLTIGDGNGTDLVINSGSVLTLGNNIKIVVANNTQATIAGTLVMTDKNFDSDNSGVLTTVTGTIQNSAATLNSASNKLVFASGGKYIHNRSGGSIPDATWAATSTCEITGLTDGDPSGDDQSFGNLIYNSPGMTGNRNLGASGLSIAGNLQITNIGDAVLQLPVTLLTVGGNLTLNSGTFRIGNNTNRTVTVGGNVLITGGTLLMSTGSNVNDAGTLNVAGNFSLSGGLIDEDNDGKGEINFNGASVQTFSKTGGNISHTINFAVLSGAAVDFGTSIINGSTGTFTLNVGSKMITASSNPIQVTGTKTFSSGADYEFKGSATGTFTTSPVASTVRDLIINNSGGSVTLSQPMAVTRDLKLLNGELRTSSSNLVTVNDNATVSGYSNSSFIVGPIVKKGNDDFIFPVGRTGAGLIPIKISGLSGSSDFKAEYKRASPALSVGETISASGLKKISFCEYWTLDRTGSATANVTMYWNPQSNCNAAAYVTDLSSIVVAHFNGTSWNAYGRNGGTTGTVSSGTVTWNVVNSFSPFALGSTSSINNPLPVLLANVMAHEKDNGIEVQWSNMTEKDISKYAVERSGNGTDFTVIGTLQPRNNNSEKVDYTFFDADPLHGNNYYRVVVTEISGKIIMSNILKVETGIVKQSLILYPNPVTAHQFNISMTNIKAGKYKLSVINTTGTEVFTKNIISHGASAAETVQLSPIIKQGVYTLLLTGDNYRETKMFIIK